VHEYDTTLKALLQEPAEVTVQELAGEAVEKWLPVELPEVRNLRVDLLGETASGGLVHIEFQSGNDNTMGLRMAEYYLQVYRLFGRFPRQTLLYVGDAPLRMSAKLVGPGFSFEYKLMDVRDIDGDRLMESDDLGDNVIAILARLKDRRDAVRRILERIARLPAGKRAAALSRLVLLSGLRKLGDVVKEEVNRMPILNDIMDHDLLGPKLREGIRQGELTILRRLIYKRFGEIPGWAEQRLTSRSPAELEALSDRVLDASSLEELFS
jgi:Domain of unknown function (DUF4351)